MDNDGQIIEIPWESFTDLLVAEDGAQEVDMDYSWFSIFHAEGDFEVLFK
jgi:hypothetical protein